VAAPAAAALPAPGTADTARSGEVATDAGSGPVIAGLPARVRRSWLDLASVDLRSLITPATAACEDLEWLLSWQQTPARRPSETALFPPSQRPRVLKP
jgi:hypothetical protein